MLSCVRCVLNFAVPLGYALLQVGQTLATVALFSSSMDSSSSLGGFQSLATCPAQFFVVAQLTLHTL